MIKLGIAGNIASGKTLIESFLKEENIKTIDSDEIVHNLLKNDKKIINKVYKLFKSMGIDVKDKNGKISRKKIGDIVFKDNEKLKKLEEIIHPEVKKKISEFFDKNSGEKITAAVVPLLFEAKMENMFDYIILVTINEEIQLKRLMKRNNFTKEEALLRINSQISEKDKISKADFVIDNSYNIENTKIQFKKVLNDLFLQSVEP